MPNKLVVNCQTGETTEVALTAEEIAKIEADAAEYAAAEAARQEAAAAKAAAKASALTKLTSLGLTEEEAQALLTN